MAENQAITFRDMQPADAPALYKIECEAFSKPWSVSSLTALACAPNAIARIALIGEDIVGYYSLYRSFEEGDINNIAVRAGMRAGDRYSFNAGYALRLQTKRNRQALFGSARFQCRRNRALRKIFFQTVFRPQEILRRRRRRLSVRSFNLTRQRPLKKFGFPLFYKI